MLVGAFAIARTPAGAAKGPGEDEFLAEMKELARISSAMMDGDECLKIVTPRAAKLMFRKVPGDPYAGADNYEVDQPIFIRTKKQLIRLARLVDFPVDCNLWLICKSDPKKIQVVIRHVNNYSLFYDLGQMHIDPPAAFKKVLNTGEPVVIDKPETVAGARRKDEYVAVLTPVHNSLGDVVGAVEVCARRPSAGKRK